tara:strand:+ start:139 stop:660 length:522 start_codon:yes stop_codon:yes gene_type:complete
MAIVFPNETQDEAARILQVKQVIADGEFSTTSTSFVNTSLFTISFDNTLKSGSKVLAKIELSFGESYSSYWAQPHYFTLYQGTSSTLGSNIASSTKGMVGANAIANAHDGYNEYDIDRISASNLHTPTNTSPHYRLYVKTASNTRTLYVGSAANSNSVYNVGRTICTIMEVCD